MDFVLPNDVELELAAKFFHEDGEIDTGDAEIEMLVRELGY